MRNDWIVRGLGVLFLAPTIPLLLLVDAPTGGVLAFGTASIGVFLIAVVAERVVPAPGAQALLDGASDALESVANGLALGGRAVYIPDQGNVGEERLFLAAPGRPRPVPMLDRDTVVYGGGGGTLRGVAIVPPGIALLRARTKPLEPGAPIGQMVTHIQGLLGTNDLATSITVSPSAHGFEVNLHAGATAPPCMRNPADPLCPRVGCNMCQAIGCALVRCVGRPLVVADAQVTPPRVRLLFADAAEQSAPTNPPAENVGGRP